MHTTLYAKQIPDDTGMNDDLILTEKKNKETGTYLKHIGTADEETYKRFEPVIKTDNRLNRQIVSFQANKNLSAYRWYKYKEAFSCDLVKYLLTEYHIPKGIVLDPFAGSGTSLFASSEMGFDSEGIELLPLGQQIVRSRITANRLGHNEISRIVFWKDSQPWEKCKSSEKINSLRITAGAYPEETEKSICQYLRAINEETDNVQQILFFALLCILESVSYTRKDGQYLRWDYRAGRRVGKKIFNKGTIYSFEEAIVSKLDEMLNDIGSKNIQCGLFSNADEKNVPVGNINLYPGSCLNILPGLESEKYQAVITSPPYCNRYDYTRTYALEHAILGIQEQELIDLRQKMLSCTVENRQKDLLQFNKAWSKATESCEKNKLLQLIAEYLEYRKKNKDLNNNGIPRMVKGYFYEMACVIQECYRILKNQGIMFMVNDNVRYAGAGVSADLILSEIAENMGFAVENILVLPNGKGNSSQQMGIHGREVLRKCVYVWRKSN